MAALITSDFKIPANIAQGIFKKAQTGSTIAQLSGARPQKFGEETNCILTVAPKAKIIGEGAQKSPTPTTYAPKAVKPVKLQVAMRFSQEVKWADEDAQIGILQDLSENAGIALGRALDQIGIHKINPLTGTVSSLVDKSLVDVTNVATLSGTKYDEAVEAAAALVIGNGYAPTGIAMDTALSFSLPDRIIMDRSGHSDYNTLKRIYTHTLQGQSRAETEKILEAFRVTRGTSRVTYPSQNGTFGDQM